MSSEDTSNRTSNEQAYLKEFGKNLKQLRVSITQKSLRIFAYENDIPCATLSRIENGRRIPNLLILKKIAYGFNTDIPSLIRRIEENIPDYLKSFEL